VLALELPDDAVPSSPEEEPQPAATASSANRPRSPPYRARRDG
jgi:hypothetical protein